MSATFSCSLWSPRRKVKGHSLGSHRDRVSLIKNILERMTDMLVWFLLFVWLENFTLSLTRVGLGPHEEVAARCQVG